MPRTPPDSSNNWPTLAVAAPAQLLKPPAAPPPVVAVDIPSGWHVEDGDVAGDGLRPEMLVSLTTPTRAAARFAGRHHDLGGRFVPPAIVASHDPCDHCPSVSYMAWQLLL